MFKKIIKKFIPNFLLKFLTKFRYGFFGPYSSWKKAQEKATGYDLQLILEKVKKSASIVKNGGAAFERDSVLFENEEYSWNILALLFFIANKNGNRLNVLDFGGSLGSTYFQHKKFLDNIKNLKWNVVEQESFVKCGKENFSDDTLNFYNSIEDCLEKENPDVIIFSSVIEYVEEPYEILKKVMKNNFKYVIFSRTTFIDKGDDVITLQKVPPQVYKASYPCWFFNEKKLLNFFEKKYYKMADLDSPEGNIKQFKIKGKIKGIFLTLKNEYV